MPTIILKKSVLEKIIGKKLPIDKLKDRISMLGTDLEKIEGDEIHVEIFPNRPDLLSEQGFARAFSSFLGIKTGLKEYKIKSSNCKVIVDKSVTMRPYTACAVVKNITFNNERIKEIMQMQEKLATTHGRKRKKSCYGVYPLQKINFPITYIAKDPKTMKFKPLGFKEEISADKVEELHSTGKEYKQIAESWTKYPFYIDNKGKILSMLPYTNSDDIGKIDETTKEVFIECTGTDYQNVEIALNMFVTTLADMGGDIYAVEMVYSDKKFTTPNLNPSEMKLDTKYVNKRLGLNLSEKEMIKYLAAMGYGYKNGKALIPAYRADILHPVDLIEDIAIAYGYENFEEIIPKVATIAQEDEFEKFKKKIIYLLVGLNFLETNSYHLIPKILQLDNMNLNSNTEVIPLIDSVSAEYNTLRSWLLPSLLQVLKENKHNEYPQNIFEIATIFLPDKQKATLVNEKQHLSIVLCSPETDYTKIKQVVDYLLRMLSIEYVIKETEHPSFIPGRVAEVVINNKSLGFLGELHPKVLNNFAIDTPTTAAELDCNLLFELVKKNN
ncbi:phenylalanine--tRNA ligase subunit beta [Candidatus Woesearchaeota archaeon]|nr:phenylalanine--tRNA ligase subunit beta [Candidatus Woesearchaeota archaeon]